MSHMVADSHEELVSMAAQLGLRVQWLQNPGEWSEHFDVSLSKRKEAIRCGAVEVTMRGLVSMLTSRKTFPTGETKAKAPFGLPFDTSVSTTV